MGGFEVKKGNREMQLIYDLNNKKNQIVKEVFVA